MRGSAGKRIEESNVMDALRLIGQLGRSSQRTPSRRLRAGNRKSIILDMKLQDIEQEALGLRESERAELVLSLMRALAAPAADITDEEVFRHDAELETGRVAPVLHDEFVRRVRVERGR